MEFVVKEQVMDLEDAIRSVINDTFICDFGVVKGVYNGVVDVEIAVARDAEDVRVLTCVLANISSSSFCLDVIPQEDDKVLVFYPSRYDDTMFDTANNGVVFNEEANGYSAVCGIAILMNQAKTEYKNTIKFDDGKVTLNLAYDKNSDKNKLTFSSDENGNISLQSGDFKLTTDDGTFKITDGKNVIESSKATSNEHILINNHLKVKA